MKQDIHSQIISLRFLLNGKCHFRSSRALEDVLKIHTGFRKDGITPEYAHQVSIAHYLRAFLDYYESQEDTITTALLHDTFEDYPQLMSIEDIYEKYGSQVSEAVKLLTKTGKPTNYYYNCIVKNPIASVVKGADRIHNLQTMVGVFSLEKQLKYITETEQYVLPMLELAALEWPEQEPIYANELLILHSQLELIKAIHTRG